MRVTFPLLTAFVALAGAAFAPVSPADAAAPLNIRVGWVVMSGDMAPLVFAKPDILKHDGKTYTVEPVHFKGTSPQLEALAANQIDIASLAYSSFSFGIENAHLNDMRIVADGFQDGHPGSASIDYMVRNGSGINKVQDLKGKVLGINVIGAAVDIGARAELAKAGLHYPGDYSIIEAPFPAIGSMLLEGKADVVSLPPPFNYGSEVEKGAHTLFTMRDGLGTSQMIVLVAREGFLKAHPKALDDFFDDLVRGTHWMLNPANRVSAIQFVAKESHQPASMYDPYYLTQKDEYRDPNDIPDLAALQRNIDTEVKFGVLKHSFDVKKYADLSFVERAAEHYAAEEKTASAK